MRKRLDSKNSDYVRAKLAHMKLPNETSMALFGLPPADPGTTQQSRVSNFELRARLPTPPHTAERDSNLKKFPKADFTQTVQQFAKLSDNQRPFNDDYDEDLIPDLSQPRRSRGDKLLFIDNNSSSHERLLDHSSDHNSQRQSYDAFEPKLGTSSSMIY